MRVKSWEKKHVPLLLVGEHGLCDRELVSSVSSHHILCYPGNYIWVLLDCKGDGDYYLITESATYSIHSPAILLGILYWYRYGSTVAFRITIILVIDSTRCWRFWYVGYTPLMRKSSSPTSHRCFTGLWSSDCGSHLTIENFLSCSINSFEMIWANVGA